MSGESLLNEILFIEVSPATPQLTSKDVLSIGACRLVVDTGIIGNSFWDKQIYSHREHLSTRFKGWVLSRMEGRKSWMVAGSSNAFRTQRFLSKIGFDWGHFLRSNWVDFESLFYPLYHSGLTETVRHNGEPYRTEFEGAVEVSRILHLPQQMKVMKEYKKEPQPLGAAMLTAYIYREFVSELKRHREQIWKHREDVLYD